MPLADYLASKYLSASTSTKSSSKKRKRKEAETGLTIADDDDATSWTNPTTNPTGSDDEDAPTIVAGLNKPSSSHKPNKKAIVWKQVGAAAPSDADQAAADAILASAQRENAQRLAEDDEAPTILDSSAGGGKTGDMMANGAMAGLQSAEQVAAALRRREKAEKKAMIEADGSGKAQETVYRDAAGRVINVNKIKGEKERREEEERRKKKEEEEAARGDVQRREKGERRVALVEAKGMTVARGVDDEKMNAEMKERERWNDPMAKMVGSKGGGSKGKAKGGRTYVGAFEPNRYGIKPGWRWDGVDRSNGFEKKWFAARARKKDREDLEYAWQLDE